MAGVLRSLANGPDGQEGEEVVFWSVIKNIIRLIPISIDYHISEGDFLILGYRNSAQFRGDIACGRGQSDFRFAVACLAVKKVGE